MTPIAATRPVAAMVLFLILLLADSESGSIPSFPRWAGAKARDSNSTSTADRDTAARPVSHGAHPGDRRDRSTIAARPGSRCRPA